MKGWKRTGILALLFVAVSFPASAQVEQVMADARGIT